MGTVHVMRDITERKQAEGKLKIQQYYLEKAQEIGRIGTWELDRRENTLRWTDEIYRVFDVPLGTELNYEIFLNYVHPEDRDYVHARWNAALNHEPYDIEHRLLVDGKVKWVREKAEIEFNEQGKALKAIGVTQDITEQREVEQRYQMLFDRMLAGFALHEILLDARGRARDYRFLSVNPAFERLTGLRAESVVGHTVMEVMPDTEPFWIETYGQVALTGRPARFEHYSHVLDKHYEVMAFRTQPGQFACSFTDVTERKKAEKGLYENQVQLKSLASELVLAEERERKRLAVHLHDDVCQNLAYAKMKLQMLGAALADQTQQADMTEVSDTLTRMMQEVRSLTFELSTPVLTEFGLATAISHWLDEQIQGKHDIAVTFEDDGQAKPLAEDIQALLFRSVRELLANVVKHSQARRVAVSIGREAEQILIRLEDNGIGFTPDQVAVGKDSGGFGLFSIRERLSQMGGSLEIDSSPGQGCRSLLRAPLLQSQSKDAHHDD